MMKEERQRKSEELKAQRKERALEKKRVKEEAAKEKGRLKREEQAVAQEDPGTPQKKPPCCNHGESRRQTDSCWSRSSSRTILTDRQRIPGNLPGRVWSSIGKLGSI